MEKVGGFTAYQALLEDARAYEDVVLWMRGEADAARWNELRARNMRASQNGN